ADGKHIFYAHEVDAEGTGISDFAAYAVTVDTVAPDIAIGTVAGDGIVNDAEDNALVVSGSAPGAEDGQTVTVTFSDGNPATADITATATVAGGKWAIAPTDVSALADGTVAIAAEVTDKAGNPASASTTVALWSDPEHLPQSAIETPIAGDGMVNAAGQGAVAVSGTTVNIADGSTVTVTLSDGTRTVTATPTVTGGAWSIGTADLGAFADGTVTVTARATDAYGNEASAGTTVLLY